MTYSDKKRFLDAWLSVHMKGHLIALLTLIERADRKRMLDAIERFASSLPNEMSIYILLVRIGGSNVPIYVGKTDKLVHRWRNHLTGIENGVGLYAK
jgi:hypothetical protein